MEVLEWKHVESESFFLRKSVLKFWAFFFFMRKSVLKFERVFFLLRKYLLKFELNVSSEYILSISLVSISSEYSLYIYWSTGCVEIMKSMDVVMIYCSYKNFFRNNILSWSLHNNWKTKNLKFLAQVIG